MTPNKIAEGIYTGRKMLINKDNISTVSLVGYPLSVTVELPGKFAFSLHQENWKIHSTFQMSTKKVGIWGEYQGQ